MAVPLLATKLFVPPARPELVPRPHLIERLNAGLQQNDGFARRLTLISAPAGFGKTTLVCEWLNSLSCIYSWLSLWGKSPWPKRTSPGYEVTVLA